MCAKFAPNYQGEVFLNKLFSFFAATLLLLGAQQATPPLVSPTTEVLSIDGGTATLTRTGSEVEVVTSGLPKAARVSVNRDGLVILQSGEDHFLDQLAGTSAVPVYTVTVETPLQKNEIQDLLAKEPKANVDQYEQFASISTAMPDNNVANSAIASTALPTRTRFRYQTFIPSKLVDAPYFDCRLVDYLAMPTQFAGDSRSWDPDSESFRTRQDIVVNWSDSGSLASEAVVGQSARITNLGLVSMTELATASNSSMIVTQAVASSSYVAFHISEDVANPFCLAARGIYYNLGFYVNRSGVYAVSGTIRRVPNHEIYSRNNVNSSWVTIKLLENYGFYCLEPTWIASHPECDQDIDPYRGNLLQ